MRVAVWGHALLKLSAASPPSEARIDHGSMMMMMRRRRRRGEVGRGRMMMMRHLVRTKAGQVQFHIPLEAKNMKCRTKWEETPSLAEEEGCDFINSGKPYQKIPILYYTMVP